MDNRSLVPHQSASCRIPIAHMRDVFRPHGVRAQVGQAAGADHETLRATYERMLEKGPERFQVKPRGLPTMDDLYDELPNFNDALDDLKRQWPCAPTAATGWRSRRCCCWVGPASARPTSHASSPSCWAPAWNLVPHEFDDRRLAALSGASFAVERGEAGQGVRGPGGGAVRQPGDRGRRNRQGLGRMPSTTRSAPFTACWNTTPRKRSWTNSLRCPSMPAK